LASQSAMRALPPATAGHSPVAGSGAGELCELLFPHLAGLCVEQVWPAGDEVVMQARSRAAGAACRACGAWSSRVHSSYVRTVADGPAGGRPVVIRLAVRRFLCRNPACRRVTFAEQVDGLTGRYLRRSLPLLGLLAQVGLALAGRAGARLAAVLGVAAHRTTLLRLVAALPEPAISAAPQILGVDDFALRRGKVYGQGASVTSMVVDGLMIGVLRGGPNAFLTDWTFDPYLNSIYYTWYQMWTDTWSNAVGNGVEAAISAVLALRVARAVVPSLGTRRVAGADAVDPFAEPPPDPAPAAAIPDAVTSEGERS